MGYFTFLRHDDNWFAHSSTILTPSSQDSAYLAIKAKDLPIADAWRTTGVASESLQIALSAARAIRCFGFVNHNLTSAAKVYIYGGDTPNPDGTDVQIVIPWRERDMFVVLSAAQTRRYWKVIIKDPTNPDGHLEIGYLVGGNSTTLEFNFNYGWTVTDRFESFGDYQYGVPNLQAGFEQVEITMSFSALTKTQANEMRTMLRSLQGNLQPFILIPNPDEYEGYFGRMVEPLSTVRGFTYSFDLRFLEDSKGLTILA